MIANIGTRVKLNNGVEMPILGLGVYQMSRGNQTRSACLDALAAGYRLIDTASMYGNEVDVGAAVAQSGLEREEVFITTKVWNNDHGYDRTLKAFQRSQAALGLDYVDLYLIHWPGGGLRKESWQALEKLLGDGKCRAIGVSNYTMSAPEGDAGVCKSHSNGESSGVPPLAVPKGFAGILPEGEDSDGGLQPIKPRHEA